MTSSAPSSEIPDFLSSAASSSIPNAMNFTPSISEDTLTYTIHLPPPTLGEDAETAARTYITLINARVEELLASGKKARVEETEGEAQPRDKWLWHKDSWELELVPENDIQDRRYVNGVAVSRKDMAVEGESDSEDENTEAHIVLPPPQARVGRKLQGRMRIGDAVDDEWLVVYLLKSISALYPSLIISIRDTDGEFLLIEAANHLPRWVSPENVENRFWLAAGRLHLVPLDQVSVDKGAYVKASRQKAVDQDRDVDMDETSGGVDDLAWLPEEDGVESIRSSLVDRKDGKGKFWAGREVEEAVWERIAGYPQALNTHHQRCLAYLPDIIARALRSNPALVQKAIEGFYTRDPIQIRNASRSTHFMPKAESTVLAPVVMTRTSYAQLSGQAFHPPRTFGPEWRVPPATDSVSPEEREHLEVEKRRRDVGIKITVGFEIMYKEDARRSRAKGKGKQVDAVDEGDVGYKRYVEGLKKAGFFGAEVEGSKLWQERSKKAKEGWLAIMSENNTERISFAEAVDTAVAVAHDTPLEGLAAPSNFREDNEDWLTVSPDELDGMLARAGGPPREATKNPLAMLDSENDQPGVEEAKELSDLAAKVNQFVEGQGDLQGAQFQDELSDDDMLGLDSDDESAPGDVELEMTEEEKAARMAELVPGINPEEWGVKAQGQVVKSEKGKQVSFAADTVAEPEPVGEARPFEIRPPVLDRDDFDGVIEDSDDESDDEAFVWPTEGRQATPKSKRKNSKAVNANTILLADALKSGTAMPTTNIKDTSVLDMADISDDEDEGDLQHDVLDEPDVDMAAEQEEFLKFAREALGINDDMWTSMLDDRQSRGAFVPGSTAPAMGGEAPPPTRSKGKGKGKGKASLEPLDDHEPERTSNITDLPFGSVAPATPFAPTKAGQSKTASTPLELRNTRLDSFEKVMDEMEAKLALAKAEKATSKGTTGTTDAKQSGTKEPPQPKNSTPAKFAQKKSPKNGKSKGIQPGRGKPTPLHDLPTEADLDDMTEDDFIAMDRELKAALKSAGLSDDEDDDDDMGGMSDDDDDDGGEFRKALGGLGGDEKAEFKMMKDFLESYKAQGGGTGAVGNLFGRLAQGRDGGGS